MLALISGLLGGTISRIHGGGFFSAPKFIKNSLWAVPLAFATFLTYKYEYGLEWQTLVSTLLCFALCLLKSTGHGRGFRMWEPFKAGSKPEKVEIIIPDKLPVFWQKFLIMALTGLLAVSGLVVTIGYLNPIGGFIIALAGLFKACNAAFFDTFTEYREFSDGFVVYLVTWLVLF